MIELLPESAALTEDQQQREMLFADPADSRIPIRLALIQRVRDEIAAGAYDTSDRFEIALDRMLEELIDSGEPPLQQSA